MSLCSYYLKTSHYSNGISFETIILFGKPGVSFAVLNTYQGVGLSCQQMLQTQELCCNLIPRSPGDPLIHQLLSQVHVDYM